MAPWLCLLLASLLLANASFGAGVARGPTLADDLRSEIVGALGHAPATVTMNGHTVTFEDALQSLGVFPSPRTQDVVFPDMDAGLGFRPSGDCSQVAGIAWGFNYNFGGFEEPPPLKVASDQVAALPGGVGCDGVPHWLGDVSGDLDPNVRFNGACLGHAGPGLGQWQLGKAGGSSTYSCYAHFDRAQYHSVSFVGDVAVLLDLHGCEGRFCFAFVEIGGGFADSGAPDPAGQQATVVGTLA